MKIRSKKSTIQKGKGQKNLILSHYKHSTQQHYDKSTNYQHHHHSQQQQFNQESI